MASNTTNISAAEASTEHDNSVLKVETNAIDGTMESKVESSVAEDSSISNTGTNTLDTTSVSKVDTNITDDTKPETSIEVTASISKVENDTEVINKKLNILEINNRDTQDVGFVNAVPVPEQPSTPLHKPKNEPIPIATTEGSFATEGRTNVTHDETESRMEISDPSEQSSAITKEISSESLTDRVVKEAGECASEFKEHHQSEKELDEDVNDDKEHFGPLEPKNVDMPIDAEKECKSQMGFQPTSESEATNTKQELDSKTEYSEATYDDTVQMEVADDTKPSDKTADSYDVSQPSETIPHEIELKDEAINDSCDNIQVGHITAKDSMACNDNVYNNIMNKISKITSELDEDIVKDENEPSVKATVDAANSELSCSQFNEAQEGVKLEKCQAESFEKDPVSCDVENDSLYESLITKLEDVSIDDESFEHVDDISDTVSQSSNSFQGFDTDNSPVTSPRTIEKFKLYPKAQAIRKKKLTIELIKMPISETDNVAKPSDDPPLEIITSPRGDDNVTQQGSLDLNSSTDQLDGDNLDAPKSPTSVLYKVYQKYQSRKTDVEILLDNPKTWSDIYKQPDGCQSTLVSADSESEGDTKVKESGEKQPDTEKYVKKSDSSALPPIRYTPDDTGYNYRGKWSDKESTVIIGMLLS